MDEWKSYHHIYIEKALMIVKLEEKTVFYVKTVRTQHLSRNLRV